MIRFLCLGLFLDLVATGCMIMGSQAKGVTPHAVLGFSATAGMLVLTVFAWRQRRAHAEAPVSDRLALYARIAYAYWIVAFVSGGMLVAAAARAARGL